MCPQGRISISFSVPTDVTFHSVSPTTPGTSFKIQHGHTLFWKASWPAQEASGATFLGFQSASSKAWCQDNWLFVTCFSHVSQFPVCRLGFILPGTERHFWAVAVTTLCLKEEACGKGQPRDFIFKVINLPLHQRGRAWSVSLLQKKSVCVGGGWLNSYFKGLCISNKRG